MEEPEKKQPVAKKPCWQKGGWLFLTFMAEKEKPETKPLPFLSAPPKQKYPFKISYKLPFISFPISDGRTSEDSATLTGLLDTGGCCNMVGWLPFHKTIAEQYPQLVDQLICLEEEQYKLINIGLKEGVMITHML
jgi:hypothetical protein